MSTLKFKYVVASSLFFAAWAIPKANYMVKHEENYTEEERYEMVIKMVSHMSRCSRTTTLCYGEENLPKDSGYIMYSNHQGKYDALGIMLVHKKPCAMLWEEKSSNRLMARQVRELAHGKTIKFDDYKGQIKTLNAIAREVAEGRRYLIFPEGGYNNNRNELQEFKSGCFACSLKSKAPIVPVAIYDSWRSMDINSLRKVTTQVHFLEPIYYEEFGSLKKSEVCNLVKSRIEAKMQELRAADPKYKPVVR